MGDEESAEGSPNEMSCADGLQSRLDSGEEVVDAVEVHGWNPIEKQIIQGPVESSSPLEEARADVAVGSFDGGLDRVVYLYGVLGGGSQ